MREESANKELLCNRSLVTVEVLFHIQYNHKQFRGQKVQPSTSQPSSCSCSSPLQYENILAIHDETGYNLLQKSVGLNHIELARWLLQRHRPDVNRSSCSLPLHIACLKG